MQKQVLFNKASYMIKKGNIYMFLKKHWKFEEKHLKRVQTVAVQLQLENSQNKSAT